MFPKTNAGFKVASTEEPISRGIDNEKKLSFSFPQILKLKNYSSLKGNIF
jgi:hypothetical protein